MYVKYKLWSILCAYKCPNFYFFMSTAAAKRFIWLKLERINFFNEQITQSNKA